MKDQRANKLLSFAKGNTTTKQSIMAVIAYNKGLLSCTGILLRSEIEQDIVCFDVRNLTFQEISILDTFEVNSLIENERIRLLSSRLIK